MRIFKPILIPMMILIPIAFGAEKIFGKGSGLIVLDFYFWGLFSIILIPALIFISIPILKLILGRASADLATDSRTSLWLALAPLFNFENLSQDEVAGVAQEVNRFNLSKKQIKFIIETEVGPVCAWRVLRTGDDYHEGIDRWEKEWLRDRILSGVKAYRFIKRIPIIGLYWSFMVTAGRRKNINLLICEIMPSQSSEY